MSQPIFPKGTKVVKGKVVARKLPTSRMAEFKLREKAKIAKKFDSERPTNDVLTGPGTQAYMADLTEAIRKTLAKGRTGPRLAPGQKSEPKPTQGMPYLGKGKELGDPRQQRELPKVRPGALKTRPEGISDVEGETPLRTMDKGYRSAFPEIEGRGSGFLSKIQEAMSGKPMPAPLLEQLKGLDPAKLEKILALIMESKYKNFSTGRSAIKLSNAKRKEMTKRDKKLNRLERLKADSEVKLTGEDDYISGMGPDEVETQFPY